MSKKLKQYVVSASFTQYSDGETIIGAKNLKDAQAKADELTSGDFDDFRPVDGELSIDDVCAATPKVVKLHAEGGARRKKEQRLHDAAPSLLAACKCADADLTGWAENNEVDLDGEHPTAKTIRELRAAIAEAENQCPACGHSVPLCICQPQEAQ